MKTTRRSGSFIKQFGGPGTGEIICFKFWQAVIASGCPGACSYCFLQTQFPYRSGLYDLQGTLFENLEDIVPEARRWLLSGGSSVPSRAMILGENQDGLAFETSYKKLIGKSPLELLIPLFEHENPNDHLLVVLSKFTNTKFAENFGPARNVVFSWSLSLPSISRRYERGVASLDARLEKARDLKAKGFRVRFRLDALAPVSDWRAELDWIMGEINQIKPEMLTIGALRASNAAALKSAAARNKRDVGIFEYLAENDPSGFKTRTEHEFHVESFRRIKDSLDPQIKLGLCKEDASLWRELNLKWTGCHCLEGANDTVTTSRNEILQNL